MPSPAVSPSRSRGASAEYSYRRPLGLRELLPAIGIGIGAGLFAFYVTRLLLQRTPLTVERGPQLIQKRRDVLRRREARARSELDQSPA